jgi:hypothetical protein
LVSSTFRALSVVAKAPSSLVATAFYTGFEHSGEHHESGGFLEEERGNKTVDFRSIESIRFRPWRSSLRPKPSSGDAVPTYWN